MKTSSKTDDQHLTPRELAERWKHTVSMATLANWRSAGQGPQYLKIGGRVLYRRADVEAYEAKRRSENR